MKIYSYKQNVDLTKRPAINLEQTFEIVKPIMEDVRENGDSAIFRYTEKFDGIKLKQLSISTQNSKVDQETKTAFKQAAKNIEKFHKSQIIKEPKVQTMRGVTCFREWRAIEKVGLYIPAGSAPLASSVLMLGIPAKIAGCKEIVLCTPPTVAPEILYAANLCGIKKIFTVGGAQAIAAMAYGTKIIPQVYKIFGAGNQFVTAAKMLASLKGVAIDMPAGPSELLVIADNYANPDFVAADLLSQAEHGADSQVVLVCLSKKFAQNVNKEIEKQLKDLPRRGVAEKALENSFILICENLDQAYDFSNQYAPEHLIINTAKPNICKVINAGSVFLGKYSCESAGDYASGTNHVLPTYGYSKSYSGVSLDSFVKKITFQKLTKQGAKGIAEVVEKMAECEGLIGHKRAMTIRK